MHYSDIRKLFLWIFLGFLVLTALVGIISVLSGEFGKIQVKILGTCLTISAASICSMACAAFMEKRRRRWLGLSGILLSIITAALVIIGIWPEIESDEYWKTTGTLAVFAVAFAHGFLLLLPTLDDHHKWIQVVTSVSIGILALQLAIAIWGEIDSETYFRFVGVTAILVVLETLVIPILIKFRQGDGNEIKQLVLQCVREDVYEDASGKRYQVSRIDPG
jgi:hypothetical protein